VALSNRQRAVVVRAVADELTTWSPRERMAMIRRWLQGALSIVHVHVLTILEDQGPLPMGRLAEALDVSVASATGIVDRMEQRGLVERRDDPDDRRVILVYPTDAGLAVFADLEAHRRAGLEATLNKLSNDELRSFLIGLRAMRRAKEELRLEHAPRVTDASGQEHESTLVVARVRRRSPEARA
jgi:DNA-binding MarR family transcriptional regulator